MTVTVQRPSTREIEFARAVRGLVKRHVLSILKRELLAPDGTLQEIGLAIDKVPVYQLAEQAKMSVPVSEDIRNWRWFENAIEVAVLFFKEFPDALVAGATNSQMEGYYSSMNLRDRLDAGPHEQFDRRCREMVSEGWLIRDDEHHGHQVINKPSKMLLQRIER